MLRSVTLVFIFIYCFSDSCSSESKRQFVLFSLKTIKYLSLTRSYHENKHEAKHHGFFLLQNSPSELRVQGKNVHANLMLV